MMQIQTNASNACKTRQTKKRCAFRVNAPRKELASKILEGDRALRVVQGLIILMESLMVITLDDNCFVTNNCEYR